MNAPLTLFVVTSLLATAPPLYAEEITSIKETFLEAQAPETLPINNVVPLENAVLDDANKSDLASEVSLFNNTLTIPTIDVIDQGNRASSVPILI